MIVFLVDRRLTNAFWGNPDESEGVALDGLLAHTGHSTCQKRDSGVIRSGSQLSRFA